MEARDDDAHVGRDDDERATKTTKRKFDVVNRADGDGDTRDDNDDGETRMTALQSRPSRVIP